MRPVPIAKKSKVSQEECVDFDIDTHQATPSESSSDDGFLKKAFTKVSASKKLLKKRHTKAKKLKGISINYKILINIKKLTLH